MVGFFSQLRMRRWVYPLISLTLAIGLIAGQPITARALSWGDLILNGVQLLQLSNLSDQQEMQLGQQINDEITRSQVKISRNADLTRYIDQIGQRLATKSGRPGISYTFQVVDDPAVNAFATMGGYVYMNTGLIKLADNEAELAGVMAHEIGHITGRHAVKQMRQTAASQGIVGALGLKRSVAVKLGVELALRRPHSRKDEYDADARGIRNLGDVGYAQSGMVSFMSKLEKQRTIPTFLSTHPAPSDRVTRLRQAMDPNRANGDGLDAAAYRARVKAAG